MSEFDDLAIMGEIIEQCGRAEEAAAPAVTNERAGDGNGQMRLPIPGHQISTPSNKCYQVAFRGDLTRPAAAKKRRK
ncbi:hypothetical protein ACVDG8_012990 [Mesorhizobium sp. ORM8.1]